ncbi:MAG TPA: 5'-nucleotidase C-terminal domain-containing protein [Thermoanaerobaculia bacterium]|nr:5'-nucleotidase C-terminal domain-containing protein [Thermoanaerobaculia bacterium]
MKRSLALFILLLSACATVPAPRPVHVVLVGTTDVHGWFAGHTWNKNQYGGVALFASYVDALRAQNAGHVVLVDSGDLFQGTLESNFFEGEPIIVAYNHLGYAAAAVGNHEFDYGPVGSDSVVRVPGEDPFGALKKNASTAKFPFLSANMTEKATGQTPPWAKRYTMVESGGARIGIIGLSTPDTPNVTVRSNVASLDFGDPVAATISAARELRAQGADAVIVIAHMGGRCTDLSDVHDVASCDDHQEAIRYLQHLPAGTIDAYFAGHTHAQIRQFVNGVPAVQGLAYSVEFSAIDLWIDRARHRVDSSRTTLDPLTMICGAVYAGTERCDGRDIPADASLVPRTFLGRTIEPDKTMSALLAPYLERVAAKRSEKLNISAAAPFRRSYATESALGNLLADALRAAFHTDAAFMNSGGIRANLRAGDLVYGDLFEVSPFDNYAAIVTMTGAQIAEVLRLTTAGDRGIMQVSGLRYTFDAAKDADKPPAARNRLISVTLDDGTPLDPNKLYAVVMPDFLATGGDGFLPVTSTIPPERLRFDQNKALHDVFADVLRTFPQPLQPKIDGRITALNASQNEH